MKKLLCFLLCLTLIFSSVSLCFASPTSWDTSDQANLRYIYQTLTSGSLYTLVNNIYSRMNTINNSIHDLADFLVYNGDSITEWVYSINTWMSPIFNAITNVPVDLSIIIGALGYYDSNNTYHPYLNILANGYPKSSTLYGINTTSTNLTQFSSNDLASLLSNFLYRNLQMSHATVNVASIGELTYYDPTTGNPITYNYRSTDDLIRILLSKTNQSLASFSAGYPTTQTITDWRTLNTGTFTPSSSITGLYYYLNSIQNPVARLSYVLASDERIAAQEAAAANEEAVVDNFIDSSGDGAASPSDIGSISGLSSGYKQNFGTDASPSGIFDIFNSDHATWFSQETKNQLDTTTPSRMTKGSVSETPLLDKQIEDIYNALGVKQP